MREIERDSNKKRSEGEREQERASSQPQTEALTAALEVLTGELLKRQRLKDYSRFLMCALALSRSCLAALDPAASSVAPPPPPPNPSHR